MCSIVLWAEKRVFIIEVYFRYSLYQIVAEWYAEKFSGPPLRSKSSIKPIVGHFQMSWSAELKKGWPASVLTLEKMHDVLTHMGAMMDTLV